VCKNGLVPIGTTVKKNFSEGVAEESRGGSPRKSSVTPGKGTHRKGGVMATFFEGQPPKNETRGLPPKKRYGTGRIGTVWNGKVGRVKNQELGGKKGEFF